MGLYPFDVVRQLTVPPGTSSFALSNIPFFAVLFSAHFSLRTIMLDRNDTVNVDGDVGGGRSRRPAPALDTRKVGQAALATALACLAEAPFDKAKREITGSSWRRLAQLTALRIPLGTCLLLAYDTIYTATVDAPARRHTE